MPRVIDHVGYEEIIELIKPQTRVLDLGCGDGRLLQTLRDKKQVSGAGIDIAQGNIISCVNKGVSAIHGNIDDGLKGFKDNSYDYVVLSQTLQVVRKPLFVLKEMIRVGKTGIISFPNFGYWKVRLYLLFKGRMPVSKVLPYEWYVTPNIHLATIKDVKELCKKNNIRIKEIKLLYRKKMELKKRKTGFLYNLFSEECILVIENALTKK
ncbi:methionine biosynthesis protein MetW [bacterium]|nr:methionine biosynthesis protein MetW [bacterium]